MTKEQRVNSDVEVGFATFNSTYGHNSIDITRGHRRDAGGTDIAVLPAAGQAM